jgi:hypothetical protein
MVANGERRDVGQTVRFQETLRRLAMIDEGFVEHQARLGLDPRGGCAVAAGRDGRRGDDPPGGVQRADAQAAAVIHPSDRVDV